ncbi:MAG: hypothetical protein GPJ51_08630 [Candidatus Heimdallarchaeota archaeon]|nr:hypothetical protein [Candidatus Heimdallarchaeota archaeon]
MSVTDCQDAKKTPSSSKELNEKSKAIGLFLFAQIYISIVSWIFSYYYFGLDPCGYHDIDLIIAPIVFGITHLFNYGYTVISRKNIDVNTKKAILLASANLLISAGLLLGGIAVIPMC